MVFWNSVPRSILVPWGCKSGATLALALVVLLWGTPSIPAEGIVLFGGVCNIWSYLVLKSSLRNTVLCCEPLPFRIIRHPMYAGEFILGIGLAWLTGSPVGAVLLVVQIIGIVLLIRREEILLRDRFGESFDHWCSTSSRLIPRIW